MMDPDAGGSRKPKNSPNKREIPMAEAKTGDDGGVDESMSSTSSLKKPPPSGDAPSAVGSPAAAAAASPASAASKKRQRGSEEGDDIEIDPAKLATMSRSERKRYREKKRRSDVNKGFDDLMNLLIEIDPEVRAEAEERARRGQWKGTMGAQEENLLSRVDLIGRTVSVLRRLHQENEQRKMIIERLLQEVSSRSDVGQQVGVSEVSGARLQNLDTLTYQYNFFGAHITLLVSFFSNR